MTEREVTKEKFKELYFRYGGEDTGWGADYWNEFYEQLDGVRFVFIEPTSPAQNRMFIVEDEHEVILSLASEEAEERFFMYPNKD